MKARLAVVLIVVAIAAVAFALIRFPAAERPKSARPSPPPQQSGTSAAMPREVVSSYVEALYRKDFRAAYELLSRQSRQVHSFEEFARRAEAGPGPSLDLAAAREGEEENGRVVVTVPMEEDAAEAAFTTVRESDGWRVVYIGGAPGFPYPE